MTNTTLVLGGTGKTGRRVAQRLAARDLPVRVASRSATPSFDWHEPDAWAPVLEGVDAVYVSYHPDLAAPGAAEHIARFSEAAVGSGVRKLVLLSGRGEPGTWASERAVRESGAAWTILRASWFCQNFDEGHLADGVRTGELAFPGGDMVEPFIDADDIADCAVAALLDDRHAGRVCELTGPRLLGFADAVAEISTAAHRTIRYLPISRAEYGEALRPYVPAAAIEFLIELFAQVLDGHNAYVEHGVEQLLGRKPRDFRDYARDAAAAGAFR
jgi:uncharacterized protein YbjT (DUF2867 family)